MPWYVDSIEDCAPDDPFAESGPEICYDGIDQGCDGRDYLRIADGDGACELVLPDTCVEAQTFDPIVPDGQAIEGSLVGYVDNLDATNAPTCTNSQSSAGEAILPVLVPADMAVRLRLRIFGGDSVLYVMSSCFNINTCMLGANASTLPGGYEQLTYTNTTGADEVVFVGIDGRRDSDARDYRLELYLETPATP